MSYKYKKTQEGLADSFVGIIEKGIDSIVGLFLPRHKFNVFKKGELTKRWEEVEEIGGNLALIEADKLTDAILRKANINGESMADRIRKTESLVDRGAYQGIWDAHKLRNSLVHDVDRLVSQNEIEIALMKIKKYLIELGAFKGE
jgi:hypothetical protein